ncbi:MAG: fibronectin type III domain-containing protein [Acidimicrobiales bacterium]
MSPSVPCAEGAGPVPARVCVVPARPRRDAGVTLVEIVMAVVLSSIVGAVLVATLTTSMNAARSTSDEVAGSIDTQLINAFLATDAQAAGGIDPQTAALDGELGVSTATDASGWAGCTQSGNLAVRFAWRDRSVDAADKVVVTYALSPDGSLARRTCASGTSTTAVLGRTIRSVSVTCAPTKTCTGLPASVNMRVQGGSTAVPFDVTLSASLRPESQTAPTTLNSAQVPLVVTGESGCPALTLAGKDVTYVLGDAVVGTACGPAPIEGDASQLRTAGSTSLLPNVVDPLASLLAPDTCEKATGPNPTIGASTGADRVTVYADPVEIVDKVAFEAGTFVFCRGLFVGKGAVVAGDGVTWYVVDGGVDLAPNASIRLAAPASGPYAGLSLWSAGGTPVTIESSDQVIELGGVVYVPKATLDVSSLAGVRLGGVVASHVTVGGSGPVRIGMPMPTLTDGGDVLPTASMSTAYSASAPSVRGGTAPYRYRAEGLPPGLGMSSSGAISGTPSSSGTWSVWFVAVDSTGASIPMRRDLVVTGTPPAPTSVAAAAGDTSARVTWTPGSSTGAPATTGYTVTATASGQPTRTCTAGGAATTCTVTGLVNGVNYTISVTATNVAGTSPAGTTTVTPRPTAMSVSGVTLWLDASDPDGDGAAEGSAESCSPGVSCAAAGNVLTRWEDKSSANHDAVQSTSSAAGKYVASPAAVNFDANGWYDTAVDVGPDSTVFVVAQSDTSTWNTYGWLFASRRSNGMIIHPWPGGTTVGSYATNSAGSYLTPLEVTPASIVSTHLYEMGQTGSNPIVATSALDGNSLAPLTLTGQVRTATTNVYVRLGADDTGGRQGDGRYREIIVFSRSLTAAEARSVREYLARKWSFSITPDAPVNVTALAGDASSAVSWTTPSWNGGSAITGYRVTAFPGGATCTTTAPTTSCTVTGLSNGTAYNFVVNAINAIGTGEQSAISNTVTPGPPPAPTSPAATSGNRQAVVSWTAPSLNGHAPVTSYTVTATATGQTTATCTATAPATTCTVTGLANDVSYSVAVTATNSSGAGPAATTTVTPAWTPQSLGAALTWWFDASAANALTGSWVAQSGFTVTGRAGSTVLTASSGVVERIDVVTGGTGYTSTPTVTVTGGGGSGAIVGSYVTVTSGALTAIGVPTRGSGYTNEPTATVTGGGGSGAVLRARIVTTLTPGSSIRVGGQTYTIVARDGLSVTVTPALVADASAASVDEWQVSKWSNLASPGTYDAAQTKVSDQPSLGTMAGRSAVVFSGINNWMWLLDNTGTQRFDHGANWTMLIAYQADRQTGWGAVFQSNAGYNTRIVSSSFGTTADWQSTENIQVNPNLASGGDAATGGPVRVVAVAGSGADTADWSRVLLGATAATAYADGWGFAGRVGEIVFVNGGLGSQAVTDAQAYLTAKWAQPAQAPGAPINVTPTAGDTQATISWRAANGYTSAVTSSTVTATSPGRTTVTCTTTGTSCTLTGLVNGAPYSVTVASTNATGTGSSSVPITVVARPALLVGSNSRLWLDGADLDADGWIEGAAFETNVSSGAVQTWNDKTGRGNATSAPSASQRPSGTTQTLNGLPVVTFNGTTTLQGVSAANPYGITGDRTLFVVTRRRSGSPSRVVDRTPEDNPLFEFTGNNTLEVRDDVGGQYQSSIGSIGSTAGTTYVLSAQRSGTALSIWSNNQLSGTSSISGSQTQRAMTIGRHVAWSSTADFDIAEVVLFDRTLTTAERRAVEDYLANKWGAAMVSDAPGTPTATATGSSATVTWTAPSSNGNSAITGYTVTASNGSTCTTTGATTCTFSSMASGSYTFTVTATNAAGTSVASAASNSVTVSLGAQTGSVAMTTPFMGVAVGNAIWWVDDHTSAVRIDTTTGTVTNTVTVGSGAFGIAYDGSRYLWVSGYNSNTVSKIDTTTNTVVATVATGAMPYSVAFDGTYVWTANLNGNSLTKINASTNAVVATVPISGPIHVSYAFGSIWVSTQATSPGSVVRINPSTNATVATITVGSGPYVMLGDGTNLWVGNTWGNSITKINPASNTVSATINLGTNPYGLAAINGRLWVSEFAANMLVPIDLTTNALGTAVAAPNPYGIVPMPAANTIWVGNYNANSVTRHAV